MERIDEVLEFLENSDIEVITLVFTDIFGEVEGF